MAGDADRFLNASNADAYIAKPLQDIEGFIVWLSLTVEEFPPASPNPNRLARPKFVTENSPSPAVELLPWAPPNSSPPGCHEF